MKFSIAFALTMVAAVMAAPTEAELDDRQFCAPSGGYCTGPLDCCSYLCNSQNSCVGG